MAYNPFNIFRRNQKALFAVLTVFIMIMFTLQSGVAGGDFFETFARWLGGSRGDVYCKLDGRSITARDLEGQRGVQFKRVMANRYMGLAASQSVHNLEMSIREQVGRLSGESQQTARIALNIAGMWQNGMLRPEHAFELHSIASAMTRQIESPTARPEEKEVLSACQRMLILIQQIALSGGSHYFTNAPNKNRRDLIDFLIWEKKADQLGINFTRADVARLIQNEFNNTFTGPSEVAVRKAMAETQGFTIESCLDAIATEFKVRAAQTAVLGHLARFYAAPSYSTPYEMYEYYRDQCSPSDYEVIPVPAAAFVDKVTGEPTDAELKELFDKYQNDEPNPRSETPGFKDPRKIAVSWFGITGEEPYYKKLAEEQVRIGEVMAKSFGMLTVPLPGEVATWAATAVAPLTLKEPAIDAAYNAYKEEFKSELARKYSSSNIFTRDILPSSVTRAGVLAATIGGFANHPLAGLSVAMGAPIGYEIRDRLKVGLPLILGAIPSPSILPTIVGGTIASRQYEPKPLSAEAKRAELIKEAIEARAKALVFGGGPQEKGDIARFTEELGKLAPDGKSKDKAAVDKYIQDFLAARGITLSGKSTAARDEWTLEDDPGLMPLVLAQKDSLTQAMPFHSQQQQYIPFGQSFFWTILRDPMNPFARPRRGPATSGLYKAERYPPSDFSRGDGKAHFVIWRTEDIPAKKTLNLNTAKQSGVLKAAWKQLKARELAQAYADRLADQIRAYDKTNSIQIEHFLREKMYEFPKISDPKLAQRTKIFTIGGVSPLVPDTMFDFQGGFQQRRFLRPFELRESEQLPYPTQGMLTALMDNRDKPAKTVLVLPDAPKDTFYVATLVNRQLKTTNDFVFDVYSNMGSAQEIRDRFRGEEIRRSRQSVMELLKKEFNYVETDEQKKKLDESTK